MAYTVVNYRSAHALRVALAEGERVRVYQPGPFGPEVPDGNVYLEGPHFPEPHRWYAHGEAKGGVLIKLYR